MKKPKPKTVEPSGIPINDFGWGSTPIGVSLDADILIWLEGSLRDAAHKLKQTGHIKKFRIDPDGKPVDIVWTSAGNSLRWHLSKVFGGYPGQVFVPEVEEVAALMTLISTSNEGAENN